MLLNERNRIFEQLDESIDIPRSFYEKAVKRHNSIGSWLHRPASAVLQFDPKVFPQGSFRLGTVVRPLMPNEEYDLDIVCELRGLSKSEITQQRLKCMLGEELELYRVANGIEAPLVERNRCWRFDYADEVKFHIDNLPCIPEDKAVLEKSIGLGVDPRLAPTAIALTCKSHPCYRVLSSDWPTSNPVGYGLWFDQRCGAEAESQREQLVLEGLYKSVDAVPTYAVKTPLQRSIQLLKRHRDVMFQDQTELKPISIIITTLAAHAYAGEVGLYEAVTGILMRMPKYIREQVPRVANPVNPDEDFADKWAKDHDLEGNFWAWHQQASVDFEALAAPRDRSHLQKLAESHLAVRVTENALDDLFKTAPRIKVEAPAVIINQAPKPWSRDA